MSNPLSQVGQTPHPEVPSQVQQCCEQAQQQGQSAGPIRAEGSGPADTSASRAPSEPPATRLPQHPVQQQDDHAQRPAQSERERQQGEVRAEDTAIPASTDAD